MPEYKVEFSIIIPTKHRDEIFKETLQHALKAIEKLDGEIIVVNDAPENRIQINDPRVRIVNNEGMGVCAGRNTGAKAAQGRILIFIDNDMLLSEENIRKTLDLHKTFPHAASNSNWVSSPKVQELIKKTQFGRLSKRIHLTSMKDRHLAGGFTNWKDNDFFESHSLGAYYMSVEREDFFKTSGFPVNFKYCGYEEESFSKDLVRYCKMYVDPTNVILHNEWDKMDLFTKLKAFENANNNLYTYCVVNNKPLPYQNISSIRKSIYNFIYKHQQFFLKAIRLIPNTRFLDPVYTFFAKLLIAAFSYRGYMLGAGDSLAAAKPLYS